MDANHFRIQQKHIIQPQNKFNRSLYHFILAIDNYSDKNDFIKNYIDRLATKRSKEEKNYLEFILTTCEIVSQELNKLLSTKFRQSANYKGITTLYKEYSQNEIFNEELISSNMVAALLKSKFVNSDAQTDGENNDLTEDEHEEDDESKKQKPLSIFTVGNFEDDFAEVVIAETNNSNATTDKKQPSIKAYNNDKYILSDDVKTLINGVNKVSICVFLKSMENFIKSHKDQIELLRLVEKYKPLLLFHFMSARYNHTFTRTLLMCMYKSEKSSAIGEDVFGEKLYKKLLKNKILNNRIKDSVSMHQLGKPWTFSATRVSNENQNADIWLNAKSVKDKLNLYYYCCNLLGRSNPLSPDRVHSDMALILYNSSIRKYCYDYEVYKYKVEHDIISLLEADMNIKHIDCYNTIWASMYYMPFEYYKYPASLVSGTVGYTYKTNANIRILYNLVCWYQKNSIFTDLKDFKDFANDYYNFINQDAKNSDAHPQWTDMYNICIDMINAMSRQEIFPYLLEDYIIKPKRLRPSTTDFKQTTPDGGKEPPL